MENNVELASVLDELLGKSDISETTASGVNNTLPDGFYLCEVSEASLGKSSSGNPMVTMKYKVVEDGFKSTVDDNGDAILVPAKGTANRPLTMWYVLSNEQQVNFFVSDMLKFENPTEPGTSLLEKEYFKSTELLLQALDILSMGCRIYIMVQSKESKTKPGEMEKKYNPITWKRVEQLGLPVA